MKRVTVLTVMLALLGGAVWAADLPGGQGLWAPDSEVLDDEIVGDFSDLNPTPSVLDDEEPLMDEYGLFDDDYDWVADDDEDFGVWYDDADEGWVGPDPETDPLTNDPVY